MFSEKLETRRFLSVTLRPVVPAGGSGDPPQTFPPDCVRVRQDCFGNVTIDTIDDNGSKNHKGGSHRAHHTGQWSKGGSGHWHYNGGHSSTNHNSGGSTGANNDCELNVAIIEDHGTLVVTEITTGATWDVTNAHGINVIGTANSDEIFYFGNSKGANITSDGANDSITLADGGSGSSDIAAGAGDDSINLLVGNYTHIDGNGGNDVIYVNTGAGQYDVDHGEAIINAGTGNDTVIVYDGRATVNGGTGADQVLVMTSAGATASVSSATVTTA